MVGTELVQIRCGSDLIMKIIFALIISFSFYTEASYANSRQHSNAAAVKHAVSRSFASIGRVVSLSEHYNSHSCRMVMEVMKPVIGVVRRYQFELIFRNSHVKKAMVVCVNSEPSGLTSREYFPTSTFDHFDD